MLEMIVETRLEQCITSLEDNFKILLLSISSLSCLSLSLSLSHMVSGLQRAENEDQGV